MRTIAAEAGVSTASVSRVMNGSPDVTSGTRQRVLAAVKRLGAAPPARGAGKAVLVRCPYALTGYFGAIVSAVAESLDLHGRRLILSAGDAARESGALRGLVGDEALAGAVLILPPEPAQELAALRAQGFPFVVVDPRTTLAPGIASVSAANLAAARGLTAHLVGLGHRRIGVIGGPEHWLTSQDRIAGHAASLAEVGVLHTPDLLRSIDPSGDWGYDAAHELLGLPQRPTALVAFNDEAAIGALRAAYECGLRVPGDLSVTGFDDTDSGRSTVPTLTTVRQPLEEMGRIAVQLLMRLLDRQDGVSLQAELSTKLLVRESTGPAR